MDPRDWIGRPIAAADGRPYGTLDELFVGRRTGRPEFAIVTVGGGRRVAVPLHGARAAGDTIVLPFPPERVQSAPAIQGEVDQIPPEAGERVLAFFGVGGGVEQPGTTPNADAGAEAETLTVSEEQLVVDTQPRALERVRVRKVIVTEEVTVTVPLRREELVIEREPIDAPAPGAAFDAQLGERETEFVLHAEEPVIEKRVVPVERVNVRRDTVVEERRVAEELRKERVEFEETPIHEEAPPR
jgi:uncharacterized protein (TIGR02271 family)